MTVQEAIEILKKPSDYIKISNIDNEEEIVYSTDFVKSWEIAIESMEKQIPKKPIVKPLGEDIEVECPACGNVHIFLDAKKGNKFCDNCGQKLDWEEGGTSD